MMSLSFLLATIIVLLFIDVVSCNDEDEADILSVKLLSGVELPLVGMGIGNLPHENIHNVVNNQLGSGVKLIDTARASNNEKILGEAIASYYGAHSSNTRGGGGVDESPDIIHVITKVWYTHLGYERTKISVQESLRDLQSSTSVQIYVHMLIHWPRCNDAIEWMNCEEEENNLPQYVKDAGPPPHRNKGTALFDSWKALEDIFMEHEKIMIESQKSKKVMTPIIASIGVSNFELVDIKQLARKAKIVPHIYQGNSWMVFHDPYMMDFLDKNNIQFQSYAVMNGILGRRNEAPHAYHILSDISREFAATVYSEKKDVVVTEATVLLAYFVHANVGVIPRAASPAHQQENSPQSIAAILPHLTTTHIQQLELAIPAMMKGEDIHTAVSFTNALNRPIQIHWVNQETNEEVLVSNIINPGGVEVQRSHPGHMFVAYDPNREVRKEFKVEAQYGETQDFKVEL